MALGLLLTLIGIVLMVRERKMTMGKRSDYKKIDRIADWDLDKGCRGIIDTSTPGNRRLRDVLRKQARKKIERKIDDERFDFEERSD